MTEKKKNAPNISDLEHFFNGNPNYWFDHTKHKLLDRSNINNKMSTLIPAAVFIPILFNDGIPQILLTKRSENLKHHAGQISFPGGKFDQSDMSSVDTAMRELYEEIGHPPDHVHIIGQMPAYVTGTGFIIHPILGYLNPPHEFTLNNEEVELIFQAPLSFMLNPHSFQIETKFWQGRDRHYYSLTFNNHYIWGATAGILVHLGHAFYAYHQSVDHQHNEKK